MRAFSPRLPGLAWIGRLRAFHRRQEGLVTMEHVLIMAAFVLPMYVVMRHMLQRLGEFYGEIVFFGSLPYF